MWGWISTAARWLWDNRGGIVYLYESARLALTPSECVTKCPICGKRVPGQWVDGKMRPKKHVCKRG